MKHSARGIMKAARLFDGGDSIAHGEENSATKMTAPREADNPQDVGEDGHHIHSSSLTTGSTFGAWGKNLGATDIVSI